MQERGPKYCSKLEEKETISHAQQIYVTFLFRAYIMPTCKSLCTFQPEIVKLSLQQPKQFYATIDKIGLGLKMKNNYLSF